MAQSVDEKLELITRGLAEVLDVDRIRMILEERPLKIYWGTAPTGRIHIGYLIQILKIADYLKAGCIVTILFADLHAKLDNLKSNDELVGHRCAYYEKMIKSIFKVLDVPMDKLTFTFGTNFQLSQAYTLDMYKVATLNTAKSCQRAGGEVVKQTSNPLLSGLLYPILQALDEQYLDVDAQTGGLDQRKIMVFARDVLPSIGYEKRCHLMTPMLLAIDAKPTTKVLQNFDNKMSSSNLNSKIDLLDSREDIKRKVSKAYCLPGDLTFNPLMDLVKLVLFPLSMVSSQSRDQRSMVVRFRSTTTSLWPSLS